jgi:hypothetical protein
MKVRAANIPTRTTAGEFDIQGNEVVAGYGPDPAAALISMRHAAAVAYGDMGNTELRPEIVGVRLVAGEVPDVSGAPIDINGQRDPDTHYDTRPGWCAFGTLVAVRIATEHRRRPAG